MRFLTVFILAVTTAFAATIPKRQVADPSSNASSEAKKIMVYYQTMKQNERYVSPKPLIGKATHLIVAPWHIRDVRNNSKCFIGGSEEEPVEHDDESAFGDLWKDIPALRKGGVKVMAMLGGFNDPSFRFLDQDFEKYYGAFFRALKTWETKTGGPMDGVDVDIEKPANDPVVSLDNVVKLVERMKKDFGDDFEVSFAPTPQTMTGANIADTRFAGFSYSALHERAGDLISSYNVQFYCGGGRDLPTVYPQIIKDGFVPAEKIVAGMLSIDICESVGLYTKDPKFLAANGTFDQVIAAAGGKFAGVSSWEFTGAPFPTGFTGPESWAEAMSKKLNNA